MADELISRQALKAMFSGARFHYIRNRINKLPAVDAVEVVRCKDCERRGDPGECPMCFLEEGDFADYTNDDGFCDRGERREENEP